ncbi:cystathionine gamma-synthase family protein [Paracrocinitomix mangrovi]|uniref:cystathionine gamma-synthase family protein n=1 Tax=Paracrocinitomix mangrovi TaxID=2862509 RepID=UPI001C8DA1A9|nr:cystathionine gamma-synthase family protein [Paracrocinitomix mangrovi]UKN00567.1 cystathionine gamma-synthase family protein [Paracrocinitomix mangrovi]
MDSNHKFSPESLMMSYGYSPEWSEGAIKCPIFQTSTFVFKSAEEGKAFFEVAYGLREKGEAEELGLIYSRINNPDLEILENRLTLWDGAEDCAVFESGMSAISTVFLEFLHPGDVLLFSNPVYGGTDHFIKHILDKYGIEVIGFYPHQEKEEIMEMVKQSGKADKIAMVYVETPANPTNDIIDIEMCVELAKEYSTDERKTYVAVDNTYMGPLWQHPLKFGADLVLYSATKYIGGHSDVIAGACLGNKEVITRMKTMRTFLGNMAGPWTGWLLMRSLETLKVRMDKQAENAKAVADFLSLHPKIEKVYYLGYLEGKNKEIFDRQCEGAGAMVSFDVVGGEKEAFKLINRLKLIKLAVSLGSTESLIQHPGTMTHAGVSEEDKEKLNITPSLVRLSVGVENPVDLIHDLEQALSKMDA